jgi:hypothetical protein
MRNAQTSQQAMFLENLWREMNKISTSRNQSISKIASRYFSEGYEPNEIVELLVSDGFDKTMSNTCVNHIANGSDDFEDGEGKQWGFEAEDQQSGAIVSNFDLNCHYIRAIDETLATEQAQNFIDSCGSDSYVITRIYEL